jgi:MinD-like ATPase involved in chromosome partitioning or flagellar assembly
VTNVLLVGHSPEYEQRLQGLLGSDLTAVSPVPKGAIAAEVLASGEQGVPELVLIGPFLPLEEARTVVDEMRGRYPSARLVLVHEAGDTAALWAADLGTDEVISPTADEDSVRALLEPGRDRPEGWVPLGTAAHAALPPTEWAPPLEGSRTEGPEPEQPPTRVIAVASPKGGQGKTTVAANLAVALARIAPEQVVILDADMQFGDVANLLALEPSHRIPDLVAGSAQQDSLVLKTLLTPHPQGFYVVPGADSPVDGDRVSSDELSHLIEQLATVFRFVVIDTTPGLAERTLTVLDHTTDVLMVSRLVVPTLRAVRTELATLRTIGIAPQIHFVLNMVDRRSGLQNEDAARIVGHVVDGVIPHSVAVPLAANRGVPLLADAPRDPASRALATLAAAISGAQVKSIRFNGRKAGA